MQTQEDFLERHVDLAAGIGAIAWGVVTTAALPELATYVAPVVAIPFGVAALTRWYRKLRTRKDAGTS